MGHSAFVGVPHSKTEKRSSSRQSAFAGIVAARDAAGRPISQFDAMIAAIARSHRAAVATRNTADFQHCGIDLINPWTE